MKRMLFLMILTTALFAGPQYTKKDIMGVWRLTKFVIQDSQGGEVSWCDGVNGTIAYLPDLMSVSLNCEKVEVGSGAEKIGGHLFYSGPYEVDSKTNEVIHRVRNFSHEDLNKVYRRRIEMRNENHLKLIGLLGKGEKVIVEWERAESFKYDNSDLFGVWELVGSENEVDGSDETIPFCKGFYGTILYTPGGYNAVSINCDDKKADSATEPADQFGRKFFYAGSYELEKNVLIQTPDNASESFLIGEPGKREMKIEKDLLILEGVNGSKFVAKWRKRSSFMSF